MSEDILVLRLMKRLESKTIQRNQLVKLIGVTEATMNRWKQGINRPTGLARMRLDKILCKLDKSHPLHTQRHEDSLLEHANNSLTSNQESENEHGKKSELQTTEAGNGYSW